jgi:hypothetical protein
MRNVFGALLCFVVVAVLATTASAQQWVQICDESGCTMVWQPARPVARLVDRLSDPPPVLQAARYRQAARAAAASCGSDMPLAQASCGSDMPLAQASCGSDMPLRAAPPVLLFDRESRTVRPMGIALRRVASRFLERLRRPFSRRFC